MSTIQRMAASHRHFSLREQAVFRGTQNDSRREIEAERRRKYKKVWFMDSRSRTAVTSTDPRVQGAIQDYFARIDRGEQIEVEAFVAEHPDVAAELRSFIVFDAEARRLAAGAQAVPVVEPQRPRAELTTHSAARAIDGTAGGQSRAPDAARARAPKDLPDVFGRYRIQKQLGAGAMGAVYLAEDTFLQRRVALKVPTFDHDPDGELLRRFHREARAAAKLKHPNLCAVYDVGEIDGRHYISMEFVPGRKLQEFIRPDQLLPEKQALAVVRKIALGMQEAHTHGVIHRDLKPDNIMVNEQGEPVVMDFGLVHKLQAEDSTRLTQMGTLVGSPAYMSKEQVKGDPDKLTGASDQYSLGVILYQLLTLRLPFSGGLHAVLGAILTREPPPPRTLRPSLNPHLEAVCLKMMAKSPEDRYPSMKAAAAALAEVARGMSQAAGAVAVVPETSAPAGGSPAEGLAAAGLVATVVGDDVAAEAASASFNLTATPNSSPDRPRPPQRPRSLFYGSLVGGLSLLLGVVVWFNLGGARVRVEVLSEDVAVTFEKESLTLDDGAHEFKVTAGEHRLHIQTDGLEFDTDKFTLKRGDNPTLTVQLVAADVVAKFGEATVGRQRIPNSAESGRSAPTTPGAVRPGGSAAPVPPVAQARDGEFALFQGTWRITYRSGSVHTYEIKPDGEVFHAAWGVREKLHRQDGAILLNLGFDRLERFSLQDGKLSVEHWFPNTTFTLGKAPGDVGTGVRVDATGATKPPAGPRDASLPEPSRELSALRREDIPRDALTAAGDGDPGRAPECLVGVLGEAQPFHHSHVSCVAYSPDGQWLASASFDSTIMLSEGATGRVKRVLRGHNAALSAVAFANEGRTLVSAGHDGKLRLWPLDNDDEPTSIDAKFDHPRINAMAVSKDGRFVAAGGDSGVVKLWKWGVWDAPIVIPAAVEKWVCLTLSFSPDGEQLACGGHSDKYLPDNAIRIFSTADGKPFREVAYDARIISALAFSHDGKRLAAVAMANIDGRVWDLETGEVVMDLGRFLFAGEWNNWNSVAWSPDDKTVAAGSDMRITLYDLQSKTRKIIWIGGNYVSGLCFSPRGGLLAAGGTSGDLHIWNTADWKLCSADQGHRHYVQTVAIAPDGRELLSLGDEIAVLRWKFAEPESPLVTVLNSGESLRHVLGSILFQPDGKNYVIACDRQIMQGNTTTGIERVRPALPASLNPAISPDARTIAAVGFDEHLHLWDVALGRVVHTFPGKGYRSLSAFSASGELLTAYNEPAKRMTVWNVTTGAEMSDWETASPVRAAAIPRDDRTLATGHDDGSICLWDVATGQKIKSWSGHTQGRVSSLRCTPDGTSLISAGHDGVIRIWNPEADRAREIIPVGPSNRPLKVIPDPSGRFLIAFGESPLIYILKPATLGQKAGGQKADGTQRGAVESAPAAAVKARLAFESPAFSEWVKDVDVLPAETQLKAVVEKLQELNPRFDGKVEKCNPHNSYEPPIIVNGVVAHLKFFANHVTDLSPVRALAGLKSLDCGANPPGVEGRLGDLAPLKGVALTKLYLSHTEVSDLSPLKGMPLIWLTANNARISDLAPLRELPALYALYVSGNPLSDLSGLEGVKLTPEYPNLDNATLAIHGDPACHDHAHFLPLASRPNCVPLFRSFAALPANTPIQPRRLRPTRWTPRRRAGSTAGESSSKTATRSSS